MKALIYLIGLIAVVVLVVWALFGITPQNQWNWLSGYASEVRNGLTGHTEDVSNSADKLGSRLSNRFSEAADVFHGEDVNAKRFEELTKEAQ